VIAGTARGRPLRAPPGDTTRPTSDKIKGVIFSMLEAEAMRRGFVPEEDEDERDGRYALGVAWPRVLDLYAGTGALAIEALSRGAASADLVEPNAAARKAIDANLARTGFTDRARVHRITSEQVASTLRGPYDLILLDPPYDTESVGLLARLADGALLDDAGAIVWEHAQDTAPPPTIPAAAGGRRLSLVRTRVHGAAGVSLYASAIEPAGIEPGGEPTGMEPTGMEPAGGAA